ncbi:hypothetical protein M3Y94_00006600 [Aphelenchoides besseyi]|nr:hypothetical protein M3Y94_00006600 [Aphelenchoides besseyi]
MEHEKNMKSIKEISRQTKSFFVMSMCGLETNFLVAQTTTHETSTNYELDIWTMKWTKSNIQVDGCVQKFSMDSNVLNVWAKNGEKEKFYQFLVDKVDLLANLVWRSMRRYTRFNPQFYEWFVSKLTQVSKFHSLWSEEICFEETDFSSC